MGYLARGRAESQRGGENDLGDGPDILYYFARMPMPCRRVTQLNTNARPQMQCWYIMRAITFRQILKRFYKSAYWRHFDARFVAAHALRRCRQQNL